LRVLKSTGSIVDKDCFLVDHGYTFWVNQSDLFTVKPQSRLDSMDQASLAQLAEVLIASNQYLQNKVDQLLAKLGYPEQERVAIADELVILKTKFFGPSSERRKKEREQAKREPRYGPRILLPSLRYPGLRLVEREIDFESTPQCKLCESPMQSMQVTENAEYVEVIQKSYHIVRTKRHKYRCKKCHGDIKTAPALPRLKPGSSLGDELAIDVAVSKYHDHLPIERYCKQCQRLGFDVHPQTLIDQTHYLAQAMQPVYQGLNDQVQAARTLHADETPWKMLEGDVRNNWYLWGFFTPQAAYYEAHRTRAHAVAKDFLKNCQAQNLVSDAYSGYAKCTEDTAIQNAFCMAHARRKWVEAEKNYPEATPIIEQIDQLFEIEREIRGKPPPDRQAIRQEKSKDLLEEIKEKALALDVLPKSSIGKARTYLLKHWQGLTCFLNDGDIPLDNNLAERSLRGPVLGRKNYYGNHSKYGAKTTAILYTIIESCKLNQVDPYAYLKETLAALLNCKPWHLPANFITKP